MSFIRELADDILFACDGKIDIDDNGGPNLAMRCHGSAAAIKAALAKMEGKE